jgi:transcriptional regulator
MSETDKLDIPPGTLELMILTLLVREAMHGYGIAQRLAVLSHDQFQVNPGSLFPTLDRLEQDGKLKAEWRATVHHRQAKYYGLTAAGRRHLEKQRARWNRVSYAVSGGRMTLAHRFVSMVRWLFFRTRTEQEMHDERAAHFAAQRTIGVKARIRRIVLTKMRAL